MVAFGPLIAAWSIVSGCLMLAAAMRTEQARWWLVLGGAAALLNGFLDDRGPPVRSGRPHSGGSAHFLALVFGAALIILSLKLRSRYSGRPAVAAPRPVVLDVQTAGKGAPMYDGYRVPRRRRLTQSFWSPPFPRATRPAGRRLCELDRQDGGVE